MVAKAGLRWQRGKDGTWRIRSEDPWFGIQVHRTIGVEGAWFLSTAGTLPRIDNRKLQSSDQSIAKGEALDIVYGELCAVMALLKTVRSK